MARTPKPKKPKPAFTPKQMQIISRARVTPLVVSLENGKEIYSFADGGSVSQYVAKKVIDKGGGMPL